MVYMCHKKDKQLKGGSKLTTGSASSSQQKAPSEGILFLFIFCLYRLFLMRSTSHFFLIYFIEPKLEDFYTFFTSKFYSNILMLEVGKLKIVSHQILFASFCVFVQFAQFLERICRRGMAGSEDKSSMWKQLFAVLPVYILQFCYGMSSGYPAITTPQVRG